MVQALVQGLVQGRYPLLITTEGLKPLEAPPESRESSVSASEGEGKGEHTPPKRITRAGGEGSL